MTLPLNQKVYEGKENTEFILSDAPSTHNQKQDKHKTISKTSEKNVILQEKMEDKDADNNMNQDPISVLVVEDNAELRNFLNDILSGTYKVIEATNGQEGLEQALQYVPDFIISDVMMPVMDGLETAEKIRKSGREDAGTVIIIAMSANAFYDDIERSIKAGMNTHIAKPIDADELVNIIARQAGR